MSFRQLLPVAAIACIFASLPALLAENSDQEDVASELRKLRHSYRDEMVKVVDIMRQRYMQGIDNVDGLLKAQVALADAEATIASSPAERMAAFESFLESQKQLEAFQEQRIKQGAGRADEMAKCKAARIYAEIMVLEERERQDRKD